MEYLARTPHRLKQRLSYCFPRRPRAAYIGWLGHNNLGDELLYRVYRTAFSETDVLPAMDGRWVRLMETVWRRPAYDCVFLGGGTLVFSPSLGEFAELQRRYGTGIIFGAGVKDPEMWKEWGKELDTQAWLDPLRQCAFLGVRGPISAAILRSYGIEAEIVGDPALLLANPSPSVKGGRRVLGINLGISNGHVRGGEARLLDEMVTFARRMRQQKWSIRLLPVWPPDVPYLQELAKRVGLGEESIEKRYLDYPSVCKFMSGVDVFVGEKLHATAVAVCEGTPAIMLAYRTKCEDFMSHLNLSDYCFRTNEVTADLLMQSVRAIYDNLENEQRKIVEVSVAARNLLVSAATRVKGIIRRGVHKCLDELEPNFLLAQTPGMGSEG